MELHLLGPIFMNLQPRSAYTMRNIVLFAFVSLCMLPAALSADEPSRGTVIMVSSIGGWVLFSSGSVMLREMRRAREKAENERQNQKQPKA